jgi:hypothetical protein
VDVIFNTNNITRNIIIITILKHVEGTRNPSRHRAATMHLMPFCHWLQHIVLREYAQVCYLGSLSR